MKKYIVSLSPSGWAVFEAATSTRVETFSGREFGRIEALTLMYKLNGWNLPKGGFR